MSSNKSYVRCEKCWRPAFQLPCGTVFIVFPRDSMGNQERFAVNLCIAHLRIFRQWVKGGTNKLPKQIPNEQMKLMVSP